MPLHPDRPALVLAPMEGVTDAPMRALMSATGAFSFLVTEFVRVSSEVIRPRLFLRDVPELRDGARSPSGQPVLVQLLGGDPDRMAASAAAAIEAGAPGIDLNFGCPAKTVNRHDGGASLLRHPDRIRAIVAAVRAAVPPAYPVSAKLRLGWDDPRAIDLNAQRAVEGGASWLTIHARTRTQGYRPPVDWDAIGRVRAAVPVPVIANGDIWTLEDFRACRDRTGCRHFMLGRGALANPHLPVQVAEELGLLPAGSAPGGDADWETWMRCLLAWMTHYDGETGYEVLKLKQWAKLAAGRGAFPAFDAVKTATRVEDFFAGLRTPTCAA